MKLTFPVLILLYLLQSCTPSPPQVQNDQIIFSSTRSGNTDIYLMNQNGGEIKAITNSPAEEWGPTWMSEHEISFLRQKGDTILRMAYDLQTQAERPLEHPKNCILDDKNMLYHPTSGQKLYECKGDIFLIDESGSTRNLTDSLSGVAAYASWGKHADEVIFTSNHEGNNEVYRLTLSTGKLANLTLSAFNDERGDLSPDGKFLIFSSDRFGGGNQEIAMVELGNSLSYNISQSKGLELIARWSKDGKRIYYGSSKDGNWEIYAYDIATKKTTQLTKDQGFDGDPRIR